MHGLLLALQLLALHDDVEGVHDPVIIREGGTYYVFCTGGRPGAGVIPIRTSTDLITWKLAGYVFEKLPEWASRAPHLLPLLGVRAGEKRRHFGQSWPEPRAPEIRSPLAGTR